jgi:hypothetical protein
LLQEPGGIGVTGIVEPDRRKTSPCECQDEVETAGPRLADFPRARRGAKALSTHMPNAGCSIQTLPIIAKKI